MTTPARLTVAIDAMGGDVGPSVIVAGMARARRTDKALRFDLYGDEQIIAAFAASVMARLREKLGGAKA